jgi:2-polyprenyl-6-methoxyphenol hydroxylase-like FAD-dependent oxidoreductase
VAQQSLRIAIAGGGLGGLTAALALLRRGFEVIAYDHASALAEVGAGVQPRCLDASRDDPQAAPRRYEELRIDKTSRIVRGATEAGKRFHNPALADAAGAQAYVDREWSEERTRAS